MTVSSSSAVSAGPVSVAVRAIHAMADGDRASFNPLYHPRAADRDNGPPSSRVAGPAGFYDRAVAARRVRRPALRHPPRRRRRRPGRGERDDERSPRHPVGRLHRRRRGGRGLPPTGKTFAITQSHWFRIEDGQIIEHWANRDDLGMARQLGWIPPRAAYLVKMARAKRRAKRS